MRVISQDGRTDIPYENFVFGITKDNSIVAIRDTIARPSEIAHGVVATYSTEEKAKKAMEMLRKEYQKYKSELHESISVSGRGRIGVAYGSRFI
jgi:hypothetical protein